MRCGAIFHGHQANRRRTLVEVIKVWPGPARIEGRHFDIELLSRVADALLHLLREILCRYLASGNSEVMDSLQGCIRVLAHADNDAQAHAFSSRNSQAPRTSAPQPLRQQRLSKNRVGRVFS